MALRRPADLYFFFFNDTPPPEIYTLPLHAALPIYAVSLCIDEKQRDAGGIAPLPANAGADDQFAGAVAMCDDALCAVDNPAAPLPLRRRQHIGKIDRKSTRLNSSH